MIRNVTFSTNPLFTCTAAREAAAVVKVLMFEVRERLGLGLGLGGHCGMQLCRAWRSYW
jgi:hypothetical protein